MSSTHSSSPPTASHQAAVTDGSGSSAASNNAKLWIFRLLGVVVFFIVWAPWWGGDLSADARMVAAIGSLMAVWWMTEAMPLPVTSLLPIVLLPSLTGIEPADATAPYANTIVFLFLGGFLIAIAMQKWNLHRRIALLTLRAVGTQPRQIILGMMIATAFLSMWVSNTATTLMMLPIGLSVLTLVVENSQRNEHTSVDTSSITTDLNATQHLSDVIDDPNIRKFGVGLVLSIAWAATIGGLGTLLGSPPNAIVAGYISKELDQTVGFAQWMILGVPIVVVFIAISWLLIVFVIFRFDLKEIPGGKQLIQKEIDDLGRMSQGEKVVLGVFAAAAFFWIVPGVLSSVPGIKDNPSWAFLERFDDTVIAITAGVLLFLIPGDKHGNMTLKWKDAESGLPWGVLLLFGGGLSLSAAVASTGLDDWFGNQVTGLGTLPLILLLAVVVFIVLMLTEITSNTATAAAFIPILGGVAIGLNIDPITLLIPAALAATCAFMLPVGTPPNAIAFASGHVKISEMVRGGVILNVMGVVLITIFTVLLGPWAFGMAF
ncbi:MAG: DASS family sodium-coupled anion symporter [Kocuria sp.]|nr:DASS family sodium-coupled anion symporter [Kocuria sp.]